ncbi:MAG: shikimate dehydrogenase [Verrucomicrobiota bacterium]|nr:shikimate dehydrogenase [Verrucomicrobiota bacterium]
MKDFYTLTDLRNWKEETPPIRLGVFGDPIAHSLSPKMQNAALMACCEEMRYAAFHILPSELFDAVALLPSRGFVGINLTIPHKVSAVKLVDELEPFAREVGAINTIQFKGDRMIGSNTDGPGFARAVREEFSVELCELRILLLGAGGGTGRAIAQQCASEGCKHLAVVNRDFFKAENLAKRLGAEAVEWRESELRAAVANADLIVNATSLGMKPTDREIIPPSWIESRLMIYDTTYSATRTLLIEAALNSGARSANGLSMLLHQGALAFEKWFERKAPVEVMRAALSR